MTSVNGHHGNPSRTTVTDGHGPATDPPVPANLDLRALPSMLLDVRALRDSEFVLESSGDEFKAAVLLWCASWHQVPASSLPTNDRLLASYAGYGRDIDGWLKVKAAALHGYTIASDGRYYHRIVSEKALEAHGMRKKESTPEGRAKTAKATEAAAEARRLKREGNHRDTAEPSVATDATDEPSRSPSHGDNLTELNGKKGTEGTEGSKATDAPRDAHAREAPSGLAKEAKTATGLSLREIEGALNAVLDGIPGADTWALRMAPLQPLERMMEGKFVDRDGNADPERYDLYRDIIPIAKVLIQRKVDQGASFKSWDYVHKAVQEAKKRTAAGSTPTGKSPHEWQGESPLRMRERGSGAEWYAFMIWWTTVGKTDPDRYWGEFWGGKPGHIFPKSQCHPTALALFNFLSSHHPTSEALQAYQREYWRPHLVRWLNDGRAGWRRSEVHGPEPGKPDCLVPDWLLKEVEEAIGGKPESAVALDVSTSTPESKMAAPRVETVMSPEASRVR